jgi:hypothetical protein
MNPKLTSLARAAALFGISALAGVSLAQNAPSLEQGFAAPPDSAKPRVWWHWTGSNVTKEGITKDLEWMKRVGIGGMHMADGSSGSGQTVEQKIPFFTPEWFDAVHHAAAEADRLGLEMTIFSSAGWSETGGPWVKPEEGMKKLLWSTTEVQGPTKFSDKLQQPPAVTGPRMLDSLRGTPSTGGGVGAGRGIGRGIARGPAEAAPGGTQPATQADAAPFGGRAGPGRGAGRGPAALGAAAGFYRDSAVVAFRTPSDELSMQELNPKVTSSGGEINAALLMDDQFTTTVPVAAGADGTAWIQYEFPQPIKARAVTLIAGSVPFGAIEVSDDGTNFRPIVELPGAVQYRPGGLKTYAFPETTARFFRARFTAAGLASGTSIYPAVPAPPPGGSYSIGEFIVHTGARVDRWEEKAGFNLIYEYEVAATPEVPAASSIQLPDVVDLTSKMDKDGNLNWDVPPGKWTILRMGYGLTGHTNGPATPAGTGLEVDKLNAKYVASYFHGYMDPIEKALGPLVGKSLRMMMMDSWEAGMQNWTDDMIDQFTKRRGYDPRPYLPVLTGRVVGNADISDRFLWDFRRTIVDLIADAHYGTMAEELHKKGMGLYAEAPGVSTEIIEDTLLTKSKVDVPMGEFWLGVMHPHPEYYVDVRMAASTAHVYGKQFVGTESFTGGRYEAPSTYKNLADYWYAQGVNRIIFHSSAHQPLDTKPGNTMVGTHFNRNITWAEQAKPLIDYMSRTQFMLSQGLFVADFAYLLNEGSSTQAFWGPGIQPTCPEGYDYDTINADALLNRAKVSDDGRMALPDGMSYRVLVLPKIDRMRPELLRKIKELVLGGVTVVGPKPELSPSLQSGYPQADTEVQTLANEIWGDLDGVQRNRHFYGKGMVTWGLPLEQVLGLVTPQMENPITGTLPPPYVTGSINLPRDAEFAGPLDSSIVWIHRRAGDADFYFIANRTDRAQDIQARFRVAGKEAELWHPDSGATQPASYSIDGGRTTVPLHLDERESVFVVFRKPTTNLARTLPPVTTTTLATVSGPWRVAFQPDLGAPPEIQLDTLASWTASAQEGVRNFSGTATYTQTLQAQPSWLGQGRRIILDLGTTRDIAEVAVNGKPIGTLWKPPYRIDVTDAIHPGANQLEIKVTNEWTNRILGDAAAATTGGTRVLPSSGGRGASLGGIGGARGGAGAAPESGLLGPVTVVSQTSR